MRGQYCREMKPLELFVQSHQRYFSSNSCQLWTISFANKSQKKYLTVHQHSFLNYNHRYIKVFIEKFRKYEVYLPETFSDMDCERNRWITTPLPKYRMKAQYKIEQTATVYAPWAGNQKETMITESAAKGANTTFPQKMLNFNKCSKI